MIACAAADHLSRGHVSALTLGIQSRMELSDVMQMYIAIIDLVRYRSEGELPYRPYSDALH